MTDKEKLEAIRAEIHRLVDVKGYDRGMAIDLFAFMDSLPNEPVSNDLEEASKKYSSCIYLEEVLSDDDREVLKERLINTFKAGAQWKKEQFEKNRIEHCDSITEEQYYLETGFIDQYIDKHHCIPTFLGAIEYGIEKQKGKMIDKACEWLEEHLLDFWSQRITNTDYFIEDFKQAMNK